MTNQTVSTNGSGESSDSDTSPAEADSRELVLARLIADRALEVDRTVQSAVAPLTENMAVTPDTAGKNIDEFSVDAETVAALRTAVDELEQFTEMVVAPIAEETSVWEEGTGRRAPQWVLNQMCCDSEDMSE